MHLFNILLKQYREIGYESVLMVPLYSIFCQIGTIVDIQPVHDLGTVAKGQSLLFVEAAICSYSN